MIVDSLGNIGMGVAAPLTRLHVDGALALDSSLVSVTGNFTLTVGNRSYIRITSSVVPSSAIATLSNGLTIGQILIIEATGGGGTLGLRIADDGATYNTRMEANRDLLVGDTVILLWNGVNWLEISYTDT